MTTVVNSEMASRPMGVPVKIADEIKFPKEEIYEICAALAMAESSLAKAGRSEEAGHLARMFEVAERRLVGWPVEGDC